MPTRDCERALRAGMGQELQLQHDFEHALTEPASDQTTEQPVCSRRMRRRLEARGEL